MYKEINDMNEKELLQLVALTKAIGVPKKELSAISEELKETFTAESLRLELWKWLTGERNVYDVSTYQKYETGVVYKIAKLWDVEKRLSIAKTEEKIMEKVLVEIIDHLSDELREKLIDTLEAKSELSKMDIEKLKEVLFQRAEITKIPFPIILAIAPLVISPPILFPFWFLFLMRRILKAKEIERLIKGIIMVFCIMKRFSKAG